ncbi:Putative RxLR effector, partial [Phytophthora palmivora]
MRSFCFMLISVFVVSLATGSISTASREIKTIAGVPIADKSTKIIRNRSLRERSSVSERF